MNYGLPAKTRLFRRLSPLLALACLLVAVLALAGCGAAAPDVAGLTDTERSPDTPLVIAPGEPIVVGVSSALAGPNGVRGSEYRDGVIVAVERWKAANSETIAGHEIQVVAEDDGCTEADNAVVAAERLIQRSGLVGVIGPQCSSGVAAAMPSYAAAGVVTISGSATTTRLTTGQEEGGYFFRTAYRNDLEGTLIGLAGGLFLAQTAYLIDDGDTYGVDLSSNAALALRANGVDVTTVSVVPGSVDYGDLVSEIVGSGADFVGFAGFNPEAALLYRQLRAGGYAGVFGAGDGAASESDFVAPVGEAAEGALFAGCRIPLPADVASELESLSGRAPSASFTAHFADATTALLDAVQAVAEEGADGSLTIDPAELREAVRSVEIDGLTGALTFNAQGDRIPAPGVDLDDFHNAIIENFDPEAFVSLGLVPCQVQDGKLVNLFGPEAGTMRQ